MNESTMKSVAMLRELADGIERGQIALFEVSKRDHHEHIKIERHGDPKEQFISKGGTGVELTLKYHQ